MHPSLPLSFNPSLLLFSLVPLPHSPFFPWPSYPSCEFHPFPSLESSPALWGQGPSQQIDSLSLFVYGHISRMSSLIRRPLHPEKPGTARPYPAWQSLLKGAAPPPIAFLFFWFDNSNFLSLTLPLAYSLVEFCCFWFVLLAPPRKEMEAWCQGRMYHVTGGQLIAPEF
jgi:hypothetical protein